MVRYRTMMIYLMLPIYCRVYIGSLYRKSISEWSEKIFKLLVINDDLSYASLFIIDAIPEWSEDVVKTLVNGFPNKELNKDQVRKLI